MATADWVAIGRGVKVARIVALLDDRVEEYTGLDPYADAESVARWLKTLGPEQWLLFQREAGIKRKEPPSSETIRAIVETYEKRVDLEREAS